MKQFDKVKSIMNEETKREVMMNVQNRPNVSHKGEEDFVVSLQREENRLQWLLFNSKVLTDQYSHNDYPVINKNGYTTNF